MAFAIDEVTKEKVAVKPATETYTKQEVNTLLNNKSNNGHTHDDRYYTEVEVNNLLGGKSNNGHTHDERYYIRNESDSRFQLPVGTILRVETNSKTLNIGYGTWQYLGEEMVSYAYDGADPRVKYPYVFQRVS